MILGNNQIPTNGFIRQEKSSVNLYVKIQLLKNTNFLKEMMIGKTMSGQQRIFRKIRLSPYLIINIYNVNIVCTI